MNAGVERPENRSFSANPLEMVQADRGKYVAAALTVLRAYTAAGRPGKPAPLGSFENWSDLVRGALVWLGCADPVASTTTVVGDDPTRNATLAVMEAWNRCLGDARVTTREAVDAANNDQRFGFAFADACGGRWEPHTVGAWLRSVSQKLVAGRRFAKVSMRDGATVWTLSGARRASDARADVTDPSEERRRRTAEI
jgi:putative DNA primase/helicase